MVAPKDNGKILIVDHVLIRDTETNEVLTNVRGNDISKQSLRSKNGRLHVETTNE